MSCFQDIIDFTIKFLRDIIKKNIKLEYFMTIVFIIAFAFFFLYYVGKNNK